MSCAEMCQRRPFTATAAESVPTDLGALQLLMAGPGNVSVGAGASCNEDIEVGVADFTLVTPQTAALGNYRLIVDGKPWSWLTTTGEFVMSGAARKERASWLAKPGVFRVWTRCGKVPANVIMVEPFGLEPGNHTVQVRAELLGKATTVDSQPLEVELSCGSSDADQQVDATHNQDAAVAPDPGRGQTDSGLSEMLDAGNDQVLPDEPRADSGGCSTRGGTRSDSGQLLFSGLAGLFTLRQRKRSPHRRLDAADGSVRWKTTLPSTPFGGITVVNDFLASAPESRKSWR